MRTDLDLIHDINEDGTFFVSLRYVHDNGDIFREYDSIDINSLIDLLKDNDISLYIEHLDIEEQNRIVIKYNKYNMKKDYIHFVSVIDGVMGGDYIKPLNDYLCIYYMDNREILCEYSILDNEIEIIVNNRLVIYGVL